MKASILFLVVLVGCAVAYPRTYKTSNRRSFQTAARLQRPAIVRGVRNVQGVRPAFVRARRAPIHRAMLVHGFYRPYRPLAQRRQGFEPEAGMAAFAAGDSVAAGSYLGSNLAPNCVSCDPQADQENTEFLGNPEADPAQFESERPAGDFPEAPVGLIPVADAEAAAEEADEPERPLRPISSQKRKPNKIADDDDDEEQDSFPLKKSKGSNSYFPIVFGGYPGVRSAGGGGGGVTAIANSYSTGKGGVATSHATAYGGAPPKGRKGVTQEDDD